MNSASPVASSLKPLSISPILPPLPCLPASDYTSPHGTQVAGPFEFGANLVEIFLIALLEETILSRRSPPVEVS